MSEMTYREAIRLALEEEMRRDDRVILFGEDIAEAGGVFKVTEGLFEKFGPKRVFDTPISEMAIIGSGVGAAVTGLRPVVELMFADFAAVALDQIVNQAAKFRYMSGGQASVPLVIRAAQGAGAGFAAQHSQSVEAWFLQAPGLKVAVPATPADAKGLLKTAIRDDNPVVFLEHKMLYKAKGEVPEDPEYTVPFGSAAVHRQGQDVSVIATGRMVSLALQAADALEEKGISVEVVDPRTLIPLDEARLLESVRKTGRVVIVEEAVRTAAWGAEMASLISEKAFDSLQAKVVRIAGPHTPIPFSPPLEKAYLPDPEKIETAVESIAP